MAASNTSILGNPLLAMLAPDQQQNLAQLQQRQAVGQALLAQGLQPNDWGGSQINGVAYHVSPLNGISKLVNAYLGNKLSMDALGDQAKLSGQMYGNAFGVTPQGAAPAQQPAAPTGPDYGFGGGNGNVMSGIPATQLGAAMLGAPAPAAAAPAQQRPGALTLPGKTPQESMLLYSMLGPDAYGKMLSQWAAPTDASRMALAANVDPVQANADALFRANYVAPNQGTPGTIARDPRTNMPAYFSPEVPKGGEPVFDARGNVVGMKEVNGALRLIGQARAAETAGEGSQLPFSGVDAGGNPLPVTNRTAAANQAGAVTPAQAAIVQTESNGNAGAVSPKGARGAWQVMPNTKTDPGFGVTPARDGSKPELDRVGREYYEAMSQRYASPTLGAIAYNMGPGATDAWLKAGGQWEKLPEETRNYVGKVSTLTALNAGAGAPQRGGGQLYAEAPLGARENAQASASNQQSELSKKWADLNGQNQQAQTTISYLSGIKDLANKAVTGPMSDRISLANGLLSLAGSEKATDAVTANNLLDKYANQIVARLGQGGLGTDAARNIVQSAYPNSKMTKEAIHEAADNLIGANQMVQAKARLLGPLRNSGNPSAYNDAEVRFDQNADPRIFQYAGIRDPAQRQAFARKLLEQDPKVVDKIRNLQELGAIR